ncbi:hypothetical protein [Bradyrhizobium sp. Leo121]|nr:hypothetical protein [Bradyrhizobium sp. Leo121]
MFEFALGFAAGGALIWFCKDKVLLWYKGAEDRIGQLNDQIEKLKAKI